MKNIRVSFRLLTLIAAAAALAHLAHAQADNAGTEDQLTSKPWKITMEKGWTIERTFNRDGTCYTPGRPDETGHWKITGNNLIQTYPDGRKDILVLPLNAAGTVGVAKDGEAMKAVLDASAPNTPFNATPPPETTLSDTDKAAATAMLLAGPWKVTGVGGWTADRIFARDGTFRGGAPGHWKFSKNAILLVFEDGHVDLMFPPLTAKATPGAAENGEPVTYDLQAAAPVATVAPTPAPASGANPFLVAAPAAQLTDEDRQASIALLVSAPWRNSRDAGGFSTIRIFSRNGKFTTPSNAGETGHWKVTGNLIVLLFPDGHKDSITLPIKATGGTPGTNDKGEPTTWTLVGAGG